MKAFQVLMRVGGPFQGRGEDTLVVSEEQYKALMDEGLIVPGSKKEPHRGEKPEEASTV